MNKRILHLIFLSLFSASLFGQAVVVNSPSSIAGVYSFSIAQFGADLLSDVWTGDAVLIQNAGSNPNNGCDSIINKAELVGKIVLIDRGVCNFSFKVLNAQDYGAKAVIIFNNLPGGGTSIMGAGTFGASVTIPSAMLSYDDGVIIKAALANGPVNISMGNIRFANDLATNNRAGICHAPFGTYPAAWLKQAGDVVITPGASVTNKGQNLASNVKVNARINFTPNGGSASEVYNQTSGDGLFVEVDSTNDVLLPAYDLNGGMKVPGKGSINYLISSDSTEQAATDNSAISDFYLSSNLFGKARLAANGRDPMITNAYRRADGTNAEFMTGFRIPYGKGCKIDSILFYLSVSAPQTLAGLTPEATLYGWQDLNADNDVSNDELSFLALGSFTFDAAETRSAAVVRIPLEDFNTSDPGFVIPDDQFGVFIGVRYALPDATPFFGFDEAMDYTCNNAILEAAGTLAITDVPYIGVTGYDANTGVPDVDNAAFTFTGLTSALAAFMVLSGDCIITGTNQLSDFDAQLTVFPNPASSNLNVDLKLNEASTKVVFNII
ncbi:MAG TPA: PA domain-containing protein, partial [Saprospiraceae bacterium]|nr:PA domain-containing protein [Saprospiraceae bacterium]